MAGFAPKFCSTHLQIHVCDLQNIFNKNKSFEEDLGAKVRRLHGTQTEEEIAEQESKRKDQPNTLGDILAKSKTKIQNDKAGYEDNDLNNKVVSGEEINDRMAALRAKMKGGSDPDPSTPSKSGLSEIIHNTQSHQKESAYQAPIRSNMGETSYNTLPSRGNKPSAVLENLDLDNLTQDDIIGEPKPKTTKVKKKNIEASDKLFSQEETQELIQLAVKEALKQVGIIGNDKIKVKKTVKKKTS